MSTRVIARYICHDVLRKAIQWEVLNCSQLQSFYFIPLMQGLMTQLVKRILYNRIVFPNNNKERNLSTYEILLNNLRVYGKGS